MFRANLLSPCLLEDRSLLLGLSAGSRLFWAQTHHYTCHAVPGRTVLDTYSRSKNSLDQTYYVWGSFRLLNGSTYIVLVYAPTVFNFKDPRLHPTPCPTSAAIYTRLPTSVLVHGSVRLIRLRPAQVPSPLIAGHKDRYRSWQDSWKIWN